MSTNESAPMTATGPSSSRTVASSSPAQLVGRRLPALRATNAAITSPRSSSGMPVTPASATAGWRRNAVSTSIVPSRWAAILMISSARPANQT